MIEILKTDLEGLLIIKPKVFEDDRGYFFESWNQEVFKSNGIEYKFLQDNQSLSHSGVLRGLHFQNQPYEQGKLVRVEDNTIFSYKCTNVYNKESEVTIKWDDEDLKVDWCTALEVRVSEKDEQGIEFKNFKTKF